MRPRDHLKALKQIAEIRGLQHLAAENEAQRASSAREAADGEKMREQDKHHVIGQHWMDAVAEPPMDLNMISLWTVALNDQDAIVQKAEVKLTQSEKHLAQKREHLSMTISHLDNAKNMMRDAARDLARHRDEVSVRDDADRRMGRWSTT